MKNTSNMLHSVKFSDTRTVYRLETVIKLSHALIMCAAKVLKKIRNNF